MTSKWIEDLLKSLINLGQGLPTEDNPNEIISRVDKLLRRSMHSTDDEKLHEDIRKEINGE